MRLVLLEARCRVGVDDRGRLDDRHRGDRRRGDRRRGGHHLGFGLLDLGLHRFVLRSVLPAAEQHVSAGQGDGHGTAGEKSPDAATRAATGGDGRRHRGCLGKRLRCRRGRHRGGRRLGDGHRGRRFGGGRHRRGRGRNDLTAERTGDLVGHAGGELCGALSCHDLAHGPRRRRALRRQVEPGAARVEDRAGDADRFRTENPHEGRDLAVGGDDHHIAVGPVLGHEEVARAASDGERVAARQHGVRRARTALPDQPVPLRGQFDAVHRVVALAGEVQPASGAHGTAAAGEHPRARHLVAQRGALRRWVAHRRPRHRAVVGDEARLEHTGRQITGHRGSEPVQQTRRVRLGEVHPTLHRVDSDRQVTEQTECRTRRRRATSRIALPHHTTLGEHIVFTCQPGAPWGDTPTAVALGLGHHRVGVAHRAVGAEVDGRGTACTGGQDRHQVAVAEVDPPAVGAGDRAGTVGPRGPGVASPLHRLAADGNDARAESSRQEQAVCIGRGRQRSVGPIADGRRRNTPSNSRPRTERAGDQRCSADRYCTLLQELASIHPGHLILGAAVCPAEPGRTSPWLCATSRSVIVQRSRDCARRISTAPSGFVRERRPVLITWRVARETAV